MNALTKIAIAAFISIAMGCGDTAATGEQGGTDSGPAGPGAGPGPTSSGVGAMGAGSEGGNGGSSTTSGGGSTGDGGSGGAQDCVDDPMTHVEIINACTDSDYVDKAEQIANWNEGDALPPLP